MKLKKGDKVKVLSGKDRGKIGIIGAIFKKSSKVIIEGINIVTIFEKKKDNVKKGGMRKVEAPIYISKIQLVDETNKPIKIGFIIKDGKKLRINKKNKKTLI